MKIKDAIEYLQKYSPEEECAFDVWTKEDIDYVIEKNFPLIKLSSYEYSKVLNAITDNEISWQVVTVIIQSLLDGEL